MSGSTFCFTDLLKVTHRLKLLYLLGKLFFFFLHLKGRMCEMYNYILWKMEYIKRSYVYYSV